VLVHFNLVRETFIKYDASDYTVDEVLLQRIDNRELHSVMYFSISMALVERNYTIYNKELLAIIHCFKK
jgi:hypothetical protein